MTVGENQRFLEIWLQTMKEKMPDQGDAIFKKSFSTMALFILKKSMLTSLFGPFGFIVEDFVKFGAETFYTAGKEWWQINQPFTTHYEIENNPKGILIARNTDPASLRDFPIRLPEYAEIPISRLRTPVSGLERPIYEGFSLARNVDSNRIVRDVWKSGRNKHSQCPHCGEKILKLNFSELGHAYNCPRNPSRQIKQTYTIKKQTPGQLTLQRCVICGQNLKKAGVILTGHASNCLLNPSNIGLTGKVQWGQQSQPVGVQKILKANKPIRVGRVIKKQDRVQSGPHGIVVDLGAINAVRSGAELYPVGILQVRGEFSINQRISMYNHHGQKIADCTALYSSSEIKRIMGKQSKEIKRFLGISRGDSVVSDVQF